jgi:dephospho-CoA kinase
MHHRGMSREEAEQRVAAQPPQADRLAHATVIIDNGGSIAESRAQVEAAWRCLPPSAT